MNIFNVFFNYFDLQWRLTWGPADVEHITDDVLSVLIGLPPGHLDGGGWEGLGPDMCGHTGKSIGPEHGEASTGLCGAGAVLSDTLVDSLVNLADAIYRQSAVGGEKKGKLSFSPPTLNIHKSWGLLRLYKRKKLTKLQVSHGSTWLSCGHERAEWCWGQQKQLCQMH